MDPNHQQILSEIRVLRQEVKDLRSKVNFIWGLFWFLLLTGACALIRSTAPALVGGIILVSILGFDHFVLKKSKSEI
jgi:CHASE2 domain-containing sensor protein